jgi:hypothetical protein
MNHIDECTHTHSQNDSKDDGNTTDREGIYVTILDDFISLLPLFRKYSR